MIKRLAIFTDCIHFYNEDGIVSTEVHIFCRQIQALASRFENTIVYCPFEKHRRPLVASSYRMSTISFYPLPLAGGNKIRDKIKILFIIPEWLKAYRHALKNADIIYQRFPNNLNIPGGLYFYLKKAKVFGTYTGTWKDYKKEPSSYRFQKFFLKKYFRGPVGVYAEEAIDSPKLFQSFSPSYTKDLWLREAVVAEQKIHRLQPDDRSLPVFVSVGALVESKNQYLILRVFKRLSDAGIDFKLYLAGDGVLKEEYKRFITDNNLREKIILTGFVSPESIMELYRKADFVIQASLIEGYGKVPLEGLFFGTIPILPRVSMATEITGNGSRGFLFDPKNEDELFSLIRKVAKEKNKLAPFIIDGRSYASIHTIEVWVEHYFDILKAWFGK